MTVCFATSGDWERGFPDDLETATLLGAEFRVWNDPAVDWSAFDLVVLRSVWDYTFGLDVFLNWCDRLGRRLRNPPGLVRWNADKTYLRELGVPTVPTEFVTAGDPLPALDGDVVVKPNVSAGARDTGRFPPDRHGDALALIDAIRAGGRTALVQPYLSGVDEVGETAIVFLGGDRSHVLHKRPVLRSAGIAPLDDGPHASAVVMHEPDLVTASMASDAQRALAARVLDVVTERFEMPLYARVDMVPGPAGEPVLIELEALDPCLYFGEVPGSAARFAQAIERARG